MVISLHLESLCQTTIIQTLTNNSILVVCSGFVSIVLLKPFYARTQVQFKQVNVIVGYYIRSRYHLIINFILIINQDDTDCVCILFTHLSSLVCHVSSQLINALTGMVAHVRESTFT